MDYYAFFDEAGDEGIKVRVTLKDGEVIEGYPSSVDESDDEYLGYSFYTSDNDIVDCFLKDIESAERIEA